MPLPTTTVSTKGQVVLPKSLRKARNWGPGTRLVVEERPDGVFLRAVQDKPFPPTTIEEVVGMLKYDGPPLTIEDMDAAVTAAILERAKRGRY